MLILIVQCKKRDNGATRASTLGDMLTPYGTLARANKPYSWLIRSTRQIFPKNLDQPALAKIFVHCVFTPRGGLEVFLWYLEGVWLIAVREQLDAVESSLPDAKLPPVFDNLSEHVLHSIKDIHPIADPKLRGI